MELYGNNYVRVLINISRIGSYFGRDPKVILTHKALNDFRTQCKIVIEPSSSDLELFTELTEFLSWIQDAYTPAENPQASCYNFISYPVPKYTDFIQAQRYDSLNKNKFFKSVDRLSQHGQEGVSIDHIKFLEVAQRLNHHAYDYNKNEKNEDEAGFAFKQLCQKEINKLSSYFDRTNISILYTIASILVSCVTLGLANFIMSRDIFTLCYSKEQLAFKAIADLKRIFGMEPEITSTTLSGIFNLFARNSKQEIPIAIPAVLASAEPINKS